MSLAAEGKPMDVRILPHATIYVDGVAIRGGQTVTLPAREAAALVAQGLAEQTR